MNLARILAIVLIAAGVLGLVYRSFSYTRESEAAHIGTLELSVSRQQTVPVPIWVSIAAVGAGVMLLVLGSGKR